MSYARVQSSLQSYEYQTLEKINCQIEDTIKFLENLPKFENDLTLKKNEHITALIFCRDILAKMFDLKQK